MKFSNVLLLGLTVVAAAVVARRVVRKNLESFSDDDLIFDSEFLPGSVQYFNKPDHITRSWYRAAVYQGEESDQMFI